MSDRKPHPPSSSPQASPDKPKTFGYFDIAVIGIMVVWLSLTAVILGWIPSVNQWPLISVFFQ